MFRAVKKVPNKCPHCGFVQHEPARLISTYCRGCGDHYTVVRHEFPKTKLILKSAKRRRLGHQKFFEQSFRWIVCRECRHEHEVSTHARNTDCPACGTTISLHDIEILGHNTQIVQTRGTLHVDKSGFLNSTRIECGNAFIEGRIAGKVTCENTLRLRSQGLCRAQITAGRLIIDRGAKLRFSSTIHAREIMIRGYIEADVQCAGTLHIGRSGTLEGDVQSRSMIVDKGGHYTGNVQVAISALPNPELPQNQEIRVMQYWQPHLAFG